MVTLFEKEFLNDEFERLDNVAFKVRVDSQYMSEMIDSYYKVKLTIIIIY